MQYKMVKKWRIKANESKLVHATFITRRGTCPPVYIHNIHLPQQEDNLVSRVAPRQETYLTQTHIHKTEATGNDAHQKTLDTWTEVKTLHKQQNYHIQINLALWNTTVGYGFHFIHRNPRTLPIESFRMIEDAPWYLSNTVFLRDHQTPTVKEEICHYSSQHSVRASVYTQTT
jgi:hypothetical protein